jgi:hypothetical protein
MANTLGTQYLLAQGSGANYELLRKQCWVVTIPGVVDITLLAQSVSIPEITTTQVRVHHFNEEVKGAGSPTCGNISIEVLDAIAPDVFTELDLWAQQVYNPVDGSMQYASTYKKQIVIQQMDQLGAIQRTWNAFGCFPLNHPTPDTLEYGSSEVVKFKMMLSCDRVIPNATSTTGGTAGSTPVTAASF